MNDAALVGVVAGTAGNVGHLLETGELCLIFPEGLPALGKPFRERYVLREFGVSIRETTAIINRRRAMHYDAAAQPQSIDANQPQLEPPSMPVDYNRP